MKTHFEAPRDARVLFIDLETAPILAYAWKRWKENIGQAQLIREGYLLCACWQWLGGGPVESIGMYAKHYGTANEDEAVIRKAWELLNAADIVIAHNAKGFDLPTLNARFLALGLGPPAPYKIIDTLETAKKKFRFSSASLDNLSQQLGYGNKDHTDFSLWLGCMNGCPRAWAKMVAYCKKDVALLRKVYLRFRPWIENHPNVALYGSRVNVQCPKCGSHDHEKRGFYYTATQMYQKHLCHGCGGWFRGRSTELLRDERKLMKVNTATT